MSRQPATGGRVCRPSTSRHNERSVIKLSDYASTDSLVVLAHVSTCVPSLRLLHLVDSPVAPVDVNTFCAALAAYGPSLTHLHVDVWPDADTYFLPTAHYSLAARRQVLSSIAHLQRLQVLRFPDWKVLVGEDCEGGRQLLRLQELTAIEVSGYPCQYNCGGSECFHFSSALPFRAISTAS